MLINVILLLLIDNMLVKVKLVIMHMRRHVL